MILSIEMIGQIVNLGMAVVTRGYDIVGTGGIYLIEFNFAILAAFVFSTRLQEPTATATAVVVGPIGRHVDKILLANHRFGYIAQIFCRCIPKGFPDQLTGILQGKFNAQLFVPVTADWKFSFPDPLGVILPDVGDFKTVFYIKFLQSRPECE